MDFLERWFFTIVVIYLAYGTLAYAGLRAGVYDDHAFGYVVLGPPLAVFFTSVLVAIVKNMAREIARGMRRS